MSDGDFGADKATPDVTSGEPCASGANGDGNIDVHNDFYSDDVGPTGAVPGSRGAAPWERFAAHSQGWQGVAVAHRWSAPTTAEPATSPPVEPATDEHPESGGCHTDGGLTVAELIAKIGGPA